MRRRYSRFPSYPPAPKRRPASDGVAARSRRGDIGATWWSRRFVDALERICEPKRLRRGRSYARSGQVSRLTVQDERVTADVQGSRARPYAVVIDLEPFSEQEWEAVEQAMAEQALFLAALLGGHMPDDIEEAFAAAGLSLFPTRADELQTSCSCPDWANPCKHVAATLYILAESFDEDPFQIFLWRGREKGELIRRLREHRAASRAGAERAGHAPSPDAPPLAASIEGFWDFAPEVELPPLSPGPAPVPDAVLRELGNIPVDLPGVPVVTWLSAAYERASRAAGEWAFGEEE